MFVCVWLGWYFEAYITSTKKRQTFQTNFCNITKTSEQHGHCDTTQLELTVSNSRTVCDACYQYHSLNTSSPASICQSQKFASVIWHCFVSSWVLKVKNVGQLLPKVLFWGSLQPRVTTEQRLISHPIVIATNQIQWHVTLLEYANYDLCLLPLLPKSVPILGVTHMPYGIILCYLPTSRCDIPAQVWCW